MRATKITDDVLAVLRRSTITDNLLVLPQQLNRDEYVAVDKVLKAHGAQWNRKLKGHVLARDAQELIASLNVGAYVDKKKELGFFETPELLAQRMAFLANIEPGHRVLEPSAGRGRLVQAAVACAAVSLLAVEIDPYNAKHTIGVEPSHVRVVEKDFLTLEIPYEFDVVLMNPPFAGNQDVEHVCRAWSLLKKGGRLVAITSPHWTFADDRQSEHMRGWFRSNDLEKADLPEGTFKESGTEIRTVLIHGNK